MPADQLCGRIVGIVWPPQPLARFSIPPPIPTDANQTAPSPKPRDSHPAGLLFVNERRMPLQPRLHDQFLTPRRLGHISRDRPREAFHDTIANAPLKIKITQTRPTAASVAGPPSPIECAVTIIQTKSDPRR